VRRFWCRRSGVPLTAVDAAAALLRRDGYALDTRGRVPVQVGHGSRDALEQGWYTRSGDSDVGGELSTIMPQRPHACADRLRTSFLGACGSAVAAGSTPELRGGMGACMAQALAVRLPRQILCGAASHEHVLHVRTTAVWSDSTAKTCGSTGGMLGSRGMSSV